MDQKDEIKTRLDLVEVIREYIQLKAVGVNFQARCPFHQEKTPSFIVSPERQIWKCFGCGKSGDIFSFIMEMEGLSFVEALRQLAPKAGVKLQWQDPRVTSQRNRTLDIMELAVNYYHKVLLELPQAKSAREYLQERGLTEKTIEEFKIGYSMDSWDDLNIKLKAKNFSDQEILLAGLAVKNSKGGFYDRFRGRIMFPINDYNGNPVAFTARVSPEKEATEKMGKYINSPQTSIYDKSRILFGLDKAKQAIREADTVIVVEGQMDVIASYQTGVKNIVASSGTALSAEQIKLLKRYTNNILFSFDVDAAGQLAAERGIEQALAQDMNIKVIQVPGGKDPDECIRNNPDDWQKAINQATNVKDYYFNKEFGEKNTTDIKIKKEVAAKLLTVISQISSPIEKDVWLQHLSSRLGVDESVLREVLSKRKAPSFINRAKNITENQANHGVIQSKSHEEMLAESLLALILRHTNHLDYVISQLMPSMLGNNIFQQFYKKLVIYYNKSNNSLFNYQQFRSWLHDHVEYEQELSQLEQLVDSLSLLADRDFYQLNEQSTGKEIKKIIKLIKIKFYTKRMNELEQKMAEAEQTNNSKKLQALLEEFRNVVDDMKALNV